MGLCSYNPGILVLRDFFWFFLLSTSMYFVGSYFEQGTSVNFSKNYGVEESRSIAAEAVKSEKNSLPQNRSSNIHILTY